MVAQKLFRQDLFYRINVLPIHLQPVYREIFGFEEGLYPAAEELCRTCLSLPMYPDISVDEMAFVSDRIHDFFKQKEG